MFKAVFIDIDNTLLDFQKCSALAIKKSFKKNKIRFTKSVIGIFHTINDSLWKKVEKQIIDKDKLHEVRFQLILKELNYKKDDLIIKAKKVEDDFRYNIAFLSIKIKGASSLVKYLAKKYVVCIASNSFYDQQKTRLDRAKIFTYVTHLFVSEKMGYDKPSPKFFERAFESLQGVNPSETVMIGDSISADISGGKDFGMATVWFNKKKVDNADRSQVDYEVYKLKDIKKIL